MRKSVSDRIIYALAAAFAVFFAISSCVKQDKILLLDKDNSSLSVFAKLFDDGVEYVEAGQCHFCPKGHSHSLINENEEPLEFYACVPELG